MMGKVDYYQKMEKSVAKINLRERHFGAHIGGFAALDTQFPGKWLLRHLPESAYLIGEAFEVKRTSCQNTATSKSMLTQ